MVKSLALELNSGNLVVAWYPCIMSVWVCAVSMCALRSIGTLSWEYLFPGIDSRLPATLYRINNIEDEWINKILHMQKSPKNSLLTESMLILVSSTSSVMCCVQLLWILVAPLSWARGPAETTSSAGTMTNMQMLVPSSGMEDVMAMRIALTLRMNARRHALTI